MLTSHSPITRRVLSNETQTINDKDLSKYKSEGPRAWHIYWSNHL